MTREPPTLTGFSTGIENFDVLLGGGIPPNTLNILAGEPGTGKTILAQQMLFHYVREHPGARVLYLTTLSEPAMKVIRFLQEFTFYDADLFGSQVVYRDIGQFLRERPPGELLEEIMRNVEDTNPAILCIDSFKAIRDLMHAPEDFRRFCYELSVRLASAACTTVLIGEYDAAETAEGAEFAVADGIVLLRRGIVDGEPQRTIQVRKMRGQPMSMGEFPFKISRSGLNVFTPALTLERIKPATLEDERARHPTGVRGLDDLLQGGLTRGRSVLVSGVSGSGKTTLGLQFIVEGAKRGESGIFFSFEESTDRLIDVASGFGWDLRKPIADGLVRVVFVPTTDVRVDETLDRIMSEVDQTKPRRLVIDTFNALLHKVRDATVQRDRAFQVASLIQKTGAIALLLSDIPSHEPSRVSRFGVEETVVDGTILLSSELRGGARVRNIEVYKMRSTEHVQGRFRLDIGPGGLRVFYKAPRARGAEPPPGVTFTPVDGLVLGEIPYDHTWLIRGAPGVGKSAFAVQFAVERLRSGEAVLFIATESSQRTILQAMERLGLLTEPYLEAGQLRVNSAEDHPELALDDAASFVSTTSVWLDAMPRPCTVILDSLTPLMVGMSPEEFKVMLGKRRTLLQRPDVSLFDTVLASESELQPYLANSFDVVIDLYTPDWGELRGADDAVRPVMRVLKARGVKVDTRPYPFRVSREGGIVVQREFFGSRG